MPLTELKRWSATVTKDKSASDTAQIPGASLTIDAYDQGASVSAAQTVTAGGGTAAVSVYDIGELAVNSTVQVGTDSTKNLTVTVITNATTITCRNDGGSSIVLAQYDRLVITSSRPTLYRDVTGSATLSASGQTTTNSRGFVEFYITNRFFDYIITDGSSLTLVKDEESGQVRSRRRPYNVSDFAPTFSSGGTSDLGVTVALAAIPAGSTLFFPPGVYTAPTADGWTLSKAITILGSGYHSVSDGTVATIFRPYQPGAGGEKDSTVFTITANNITIKNCMIANASQPAATGTGDGIRSGSSGVTRSYIVLENVAIFYMGRNGINCAGEGSANWAAETGYTFYGINQSSFRDVLVSQCRGNGFRLYGTADLNMYGCIAQSNRLNGLYGSNSLVTNLTGCSFNSNCVDSAQTNGTESQVQLRTCHAFSIAALDIEEFQSYTSKYALVLNNCFAGALTGASLLNSTAVAATIGVYLMSGSKGNTFNGIKIDRVATSFSINASDNNTGNFVGPIGIATANATCPGTIVVPAQASSVASTSGGNFALLPLGDGDETGAVFTAALQLPLVNGTAAYTGTLKEGLLIWDSSAAVTAKLKYYDGSAWRTVTAV